MLAGIWLSKSFSGAQQSLHGFENTQEGSTLTLPNLASPFSPAAALKFGAIFLALHIAGSLAKRALGTLGFYAVALVGGAISSASAVASAANLASAGKVPLEVAGTGTILATAMSALVDVPILARIGRNRDVTRQALLTAVMLALFGALGIITQLIGHRVV